MLAVALMLGMLVAPVVLLILGFKVLAVFVGIYVALSMPSIIRVLYVTIKTRAWPKIVGGPGVTWFGKYNGDPNITWFGKQKGS